jgi:hypothetical protein
MPTDTDDAYRDAPRTLGGTAKLEQPDEVRTRIAERRVTFEGGFDPKTHTVGGRTAKLDKPPEVLEREAAMARERESDTTPHRTAGDTTPRRFTIAVVLAVAVLAAVAAVAAFI